MGPPYLMVGVQLVIQLFKGAAAAATPNNACYQGPIFAAGYATSRTSHLCAVAGICIPWLGEGGGPVSEKALYLLHAALAV